MTAMVTFREMCSATMLALLSSAVVAANAQPPEAINGATATALIDRALTGCDRHLFTIRFDGAGEPVGTTGTAAARRLGAGASARNSNDEARTRPSGRTGNRAGVGRHAARARIT